MNKNEMLKVIVTNEEFEHIRKTVFSLVGFEFTGEVKTEYYNGVKLCIDGGSVTIGYKDKSTLARALFQFALNHKKSDFKLEETPHFDTFGVSLDVSRNGVLTVASVKKYIEYMAALGFNAFMLYTEDVFEMEKYPRFGYMRGRYTVADLKEIDDYAYSFGIEVIPCIETLGHLKQYLRWKEAAPIRDTVNCLLVGSEATYEFIEEIFKTTRKAFRSNKIQLNLDETHDLGTGAYARKNGYKDRGEIFNEHLKVVSELCKKYNYEPLMAGDMFFRNESVNNDYYDPDVCLPENASENIPENMIITAWDYYHTDKSHFDRFFNEHKKLKRPIWYCGSLWTWSNFIEDVKFTRDVAYSALYSCIENGIRDVYISAWGDNGAETNLMRTVSTLPIFSEFLYKGREGEADELDTISKFLTGISISDMLTISKIHSDYHCDFSLSRKIFYDDILYDLIDFEYDYEKVMKDFKEAYEFTKSSDNEYFVYCNLFSKCVLEKCEILHKVRTAYKEDDREYLKAICDTHIPQLIKTYEAFYEVFEAEWMKYRKPNGIEIMNERFGAMIYRMKFIIKRIESYLNGETSSIEGLCDERMFGGMIYVGTHNLMSPTSSVE